MSYDPYDAPRERTTKRYYREERRGDQDPRYADPRDQYLGMSHDLVPRGREDSDLSIEEIRRDFPPPGYASRDIRRSRSAGYYDDYDDRGPSRDYDRSVKKYDGAYYSEEHKKKVRMLSKQEKIIAAVTGAAVAVGGKELYDRRDAKKHDSDVQRNILISAALGAAGALAGYSGTEVYNKLREKEAKKAGYAPHKGRGVNSSDESDDEDEKEKKGHKNFLEAALAAAGLGTAVKALTGGSAKDDRSDTRSTRSTKSRRSRSSSSTRSTRSRGGKDKDGKVDAASKIQKAAMASLIAGATEAFRVSKEPGGWKGEKAKRIFTAAAGAAAIDGAQKGDKGGSKIGLAESVIGGLLGNRVINGSKKNIEEDEKTGRSRSRSRARSKSGSGSGSGGVSGLAALATAGLGALGAKKVVDSHERSRSRRDDDSDDDRGSSKPRHRSRSRSVVDTARRGLAKLGIGNGPTDEDDRDRRDRSRRDHDDYDDSSKSSRRHRDDYDDYDRDRDYDRDSRRSGGRDSYDDDRSYHSRHRDRRSDRGTVARRGSSPSDIDSEEDEKRGKKTRGKQILTTGLAAVATIHAAANVYQSMEKRKKRQKAVREGRLSLEGAKKLKSKAILQDAASVGIAALGIKGAISEIKEARELSQEMHEWKEKREERRNRRLRRLSLTGGRSVDGDGYGRHRADNWYTTAPPKVDRYDDGPRYSDGNPYAALPPPSDRR